MSDVSEYVKDLKGIDWTSKKGLFVYCATFFILELIVAGMLNQAGLSLSISLTILVLVSTQVVVLVAWLVHRLFISRPSDYSIALAIDTEEGGSESYAKLKKNLKIVLKERDLDKLVRLQILPTDKIFRNDRDAEKYINKNGFTVLIWGRTVKGTISNIDLVRYELRVSYQHKSNESNAINTVLVESNTRSFWDVQSTNSLPTLQIVSGNVAEIGLMALAVCLGTIGTLESVNASTRILEDLNDVFLAKTESENFPSLVIAKNHTLNILLKNYYLLSGYYYTSKEDYAMAHEYNLKILKLKPNDWRSHQNCAATYCLKGEYDLAKSHTYDAIRLNPKNELAKLNKAFFSFYEHDYKKAVELLKRLKEKKILARTKILDVIRFNQHMYDKDNNPAILYYAAYLNIKFADPVLGKKQLSEFISIVQNDNSYNLLIEEARKLQ